MKLHLLGQVTQDVDFKASLCLLGVLEDEEKQVVGDDKVDQNLRGHSRPLPDKKQGNVPQIFQFGQGH